MSKCQKIEDIHVETSAEEMEVYKSDVIFLQKEMQKKKPKSSGDLCSLMEKTSYS